MENTTYTYIINRRHTNEYKIGKSKTPLKRIKPLQTGNAGKLDIVDCFHSDEKLEARLHRMFALDRTKGEWFIFSEQKLEFLLTFLRNRYISFSDQLEYNQH